jgi:hypothetical protein
MILTAIRNGLVYHFNAARFVASSSASVSSVRASHSRYRSALKCLTLSLVRAF